MWEYGFYEFCAFFHRDIQPYTDIPYKMPLQREIFEEDVQVEFILNDSQSSAPHPVDSMKAPEEVEEKEDLETNSDGFSILVVENNEELKAFLKSILTV